jgi:predicted enzyme related to lactoylglutathione lyase
MNKTIITLAIVMGFNLHASAQDKKDTSMVAKVTGIGGIFFKCKDPKKTAQWYKNNLGIESDAYGHTFKWYEDKAGKRIGRTVWSPFPESTDYFGNSGQQVMINYRVQHIELLVDELRKKGVKIVGEVKNYDGIGKFAHIEDADGNRIELWEPVEEHD